MCICRNFNNIFSYTTTTLLHKEHGKKKTLKFFKQTGNISSKDIGSYGSLERAVILQLES